MSEEKFKYTDEDIERIVSLYNEARKRRQRQEQQSSGSSSHGNDNDEIKIEQLHDKRKNREKFKAKELSFMISVKTKRANMYDFLKNLEKLFRRLLAIAKMNTGSDDDYVRFFFEKSPTRPFSTAIVKLKDLNVRYFMDTFERMLNSGENILADGWNTVVSIAIFTNDDYRRKQEQKTKPKTKQKKIYTFLQKGADDGGGGRKNPPKNNRSIRHGAFQVVSSCFDSICCFFVALLVSLSFLRKDERERKIRSTPNKLNTIFSRDEIVAIYRICGISEKEKICGKHYEIVYERYLKEKGIDLVVFSDLYYNTIVYDSRTDKHGNILRLRNDVVCLWLNRNHYDVVENMRIFTKSTTSFCEKCMRSLSCKGEFVFNHVCRTFTTCRKCYSSAKECTSENDVMMLQCSSCNVIFENSLCFQNHLFQKVFIGQDKRTKITPCQYFFFCNTCYKIVPRFLFITKNKSVVHDCEKEMCYRCKKYERNHVCFIKPITSGTKSDNPVLFFF